LQISKQNLGRLQVRRDGGAAYSWPYGEADWEALGWIQDAALDSKAFSI
jgi:hypothetical protein